MPLYSFNWTDFISKLLMKRYFLIEKTKDAERIGRFNAYILQLHIDCTKINYYHDFFFMYLFI